MGRLCFDMCLVTCSVWGSTSAQTGLVLGEMNPGERIDDYFHTPGKSVLEVVYPKGMMVC